jgi:phosphatidylserine/phosphatidylglycerophosphate/cardiolipin synthase-like enzyme
VSILVIFHYCLSLLMVCRYVSELLYIHSKVMIIDDRTVIVSASLCQFY